MNNHATQADEEPDNPYHRKYWKGSHKIDKAYGPEYDWKLMKWRLGEKDLCFNDESIIVGDKQFNSTSGLNELIFYKKPKKFTEHDHHIYKHILELTGVHRDSRGYLNHKGCKEKFETIIKPLYKLNKRRKRRCSAKLTAKKQSSIEPELSKISEQKVEKLIKPELSIISEQKIQTQTNLESSGEVWSKYYAQNDPNILVDYLRSLYNNGGSQEETTKIIKELENLGIIEK